MGLNVNIFYVLKYSSLWQYFSIWEYGILRKMLLECGCLVPTVSSQSGKAQEFYRFSRWLLSRPHCFVVCVCLEILYEKCKGCVQRGITRRRRVQGGEAVASWAWHEEHACTRLANYSFLLFIYYSYAIGPNTNIIYIYIMDLICV